MSNFHHSRRRSHSRHSNSISYFLLLLLFLSLSLSTMTVVPSLSPPCSPTTGPVVSTIPLVAFFERVQETALHVFGESNFDPKLYVDLSLKHNLSTTVDAFDKLLKSANGSVSVQDLKEFIEKYFDGAGNDLIHHEPEDFVLEPEGFLPKVENQEVRAWALEVHSLWRNLSRKVSSSVMDRPELHSLLPLPEPVVVPGSRFREVYYWDSYWVIRGLLASKMYETAKAIVTNLISLIHTYGYVLNGARAYYTNRSQPPLLTAMVYEIYNRTGDLELVKKALPALLKEYHFWNSGIHKVTIQDAQANNHSLSRYYAMWNKPRPESSTVDKISASKFSNASDKQHFYRELATTAESGWDFSTRWMRNSSEFTTLATTSILPVDLNVFILKMEIDIAAMAKVTGQKSTAEKFLEASQARQKAINSVFWNDKMGQWLDYWINNDTVCEFQESEKWEGCNQNQNVFASNFVPLWIDLFNSESNQLKNVMSSLQSSGLIREAGIATSLKNSGQQWDFPNGWAPLQHMIVEGLARSGSQEARTMAEKIAISWIRTNYAVYKKTGAMHEKFDVDKCGQYGGGGEYIPQTGFGWSNGVVLAFLEEFGWPQDLKIDCL
ncbi:Trehalase domain-containing protein [Cephalotus follicularis]|uniref:Trehalase n=1 Tax=Cephalotus follicularis TaxID=3775 RepID=A0A1Q3BL35_CEPFO|nr:Trehalase domain-containing protein [Cephalotus follicularis]